MPTPETTILDDRAVSEIEARNKSGRYPFIETVDALCRTARALRADVDKFSKLADERHDLLSAERRANDDLRAERSKMLQALERAQQGVIEGPSSTEYEAWLETRPDITARFETDTFKRTTGYEIWRNSWLRLRELISGSND